MMNAYRLTRQDVESVAGREVSDEELVNVGKALDHALSDIVSDTIFQVLGGDGDETDEPGEDDGEEMRADEVKAGDWVREFGMEWVYARTARLVGDSLLVNDETVIDSDSAVLVVRD